jgi:thiol-disulfide isomerase/thioredoxin
MKRLSLLVAVVFSALAVRAFLFSAGPPPPKLTVSDPPRPLPEIVFDDGAGAARKLSDFRGKVVLLNVWATWCVPCRKEMPTLDRLQGQLGGPNFEVIALSIDHRGAEVVRKFYADVGIKNLAITVDAKAEAPFKLGTVGVPTTLLINREGMEIGRLIGTAEWGSPEIVAFLKKTISQKPGSFSSTPTQEKPL